MNNTLKSLDFDITQLKKMGIALIGTTIYSIGVNLFLVPAKLYSGGVLGFSQIIRTLLFRFFDLSMINFDIAGIIYYLLNIPIFILAANKIGKRFLVKTVACVTWGAILMSVIPIPTEPILNDDILASCLIGGIISGIGIGLSLRMGSSNGGMDILGLVMIKHDKDASVGKFNLMSNAVLYFICMILFDIPTTIYSFIFASVVSTTIDRLHSQNINVEAKIITKLNTDLLEKEIMDKLNRGVTRWDSHGAYTGECSKVLFVLLSKYEVEALRHIVRQHDPSAFLVTNERVAVDGNFIKKL